MKFKSLIIILILIIALPISVFAAGDSNPCKTKFPIILCHGMGASASISLFGVSVADYWWGIKPALESKGATVYVTSVNGMDSTANKAAAWKSQVLLYMASKGISKVNIVAHSHGTIYTRYAMTNLGMGTKVASYTSLCGPHRGSAVADVLFNVVGDKGGWLLGATLDVVYALVFGDIHPNSLQNGKDLLRSYMINTFNPNTPNVAGIYYQSYATRNTLLVTNDVVLTPTYLLLNYYEGVNDGLVSETSAKWGTYRGMQSGTWIFGGVSHLNAVNQFMGITPGFDAPGWICGIVNDLKTKGY